MFKKIAILLTAIALTGCAASKNEPATTTTTQETPMTQSTLQPAPHPDNRPSDEYEELWGEKVPNPYKWLEDASNPEVKEWAAAQDQRARQYLQKMPSRAEYHAMLESLLYYDNIGTPSRAGEYLFYSKRGKTEEKSVVYVKKDGENERILIDPSKLSEDGSISLGGFAPCHNGKILAYALKKNNADSSVMYFLNVETGEKLTDVISGARYASPSWLPDDSGFYYTYFPEDDAIPVEQRPGMTTVKFHKMGTPQSEDILIKDALNDATKFHQAEISNDGKWLTYSIDHGWNGNEVYIKHVSQDTWTKLPVQDNQHYYTTIYQNYLYIMTDEGAPHFQIARIPLSTDNNAPNLARDQWQTIIPESESVLEGFSIVSNKLIVNGIFNVVNNITIYDLDGQNRKEVQLPDLGSASAVHGEPDQKTGFYSFTSFKMPRYIYELNPETGESTLWNKVETTAPLNDIITEQLWATSKDGTLIPMFVIRKESTPLDGTARAIVYGYGGFSYAVTPTFSPQIHAWLARGGIYVYANLRGGSEFGEDWHNAGKESRKQNVFDDYYAVAEHLIAQKYTSKATIAAYGGSNGGLLTGAAMTQRPDLYGAIVCAVPLLDMVRYHLFGSGKTWISEYSSVEVSEESFKFIKAYSPYANVHKGTQYPPILFLGADSDDRVDPMHARKMTAAIQDAIGNDNPVLLRIEKNSGHGGADMVKQKIEELSDMYGFLETVLKP